jgi:hypothetical protein
MKEGLQLRDGKAIAEPWRGQDELRSGRICLDFLPEICDENVQVVRVFDGIKPPHRFEEFPMGNGSAFLPDEILQQFRFLGSEMGHLQTSPAPALHEIDFEAARLEETRKSGRGMLVPVQHGYLALDMTVSSEGTEGNAGANASMVKNMDSTKHSSSSQSGVNCAPSSRNKISAPASFISCVISIPPFPHEIRMASPNPLSICTTSREKVMKTRFSIAGNWLRHSETGTLRGPMPNRGSVFSSNPF